MKVLSNKEEHWSRFPELRRTFNDSPVPDRFFHNGGKRSPYTTVFDDLHDLAEIGAIVGSGQERLLASIQQVPPMQTPHEQEMRIKGLLRDLTRLQDELRSRLNWILYRVEEGIHKVEIQLTIEQKNILQQHYRNSNDGNA